METSRFTQQQEAFANAVPIETQGATSDCFTVKLYGKLHFLKRLKNEYRSNPRYVAALKKEFEAGYSLEHQNLVRYVACGDDYLLSEYVDGETLDKFAATHPEFFKKRANTDRLIVQLLNVLKYLHSHQIVHLDLKPENILITRIGHELKLTDLGFCYTDRHTDTTGGSEFYAAPEQLEASGVVDERTDLFAVGRILSTLPCANHYKHLITGCIRRNKNDRFQSAAQARQSITRQRIVRRVAWSALAMVFSFTLLLLIIAGKKQHVASNKISNPSSNVIDTMPHTKNAVVPESEKIYQYVASSSEPQFGENADAGRVEPSIGTTPVPPAPETKAQQSTPNDDSFDDDGSDIIIPTKKPSPPKRSDILALRSEMQRIATPYYNSLLKHYNDSAYNSLQKRTNFTYAVDLFAHQVRNEYKKLWNKKKDSLGSLTQRAFEVEGNETILFFTNNLIYRMKAKSGDSEYKGKKYEYYEHVKAINNPLY